MKKGFKITAVVLGLLLLAACTTFSAMTLFAVRAAAQDDWDEDYEEHASSEDGVVIAGEYTIRPTTAISDAYRSGDSSALSDRDKETLSMASDVLAETVTEGMSDYEKELAVYEWMVSHLAYDEGSLVVIPDTEADCDNPYGVLKYHNAVCVGYATTFRLFMQMLDIPCMVVHNSQLYHSWDLVQLDGEWYHVDIYSDVGTTGYAHFNLPDSVQYTQQDWDTSFFPAAGALTYNIAWQNREEVSDVYAVPAAMRRAMDSGNASFALAFSGEPDENDRMLTEQMVNALDNALMENHNPGQPNMIQSWNWAWDENSDTYALLISFDYDNQTFPVDPEDQPDWDQADQALRDAFGDLFELSVYDGYYVTGGDWGGAMG